MMQQKRLTLPVLPRQEEHATIWRALEQVRDGSVQVVLIQGDEGTGRSSLAASALAESPAEVSWRASTIFDPRSAAAPFVSLRKLLSDLIKSSLTLPGLSEGATAIEKELSGAQLSLLLNFISSEDSAGLFCEGREDAPEEKELDDLSSEMSKDGLIVLINALKCLFKALTSVAPVVLLIQDLIWSDSATLKVLEDILADPGLKRFFLCTTLPQKEAHEHEAFLWKERLEKAIVSKERNGFQTISLGDLNVRQVKGLLAEATSLEAHNVEELAETVFGFTHGNLFHLKQFLEHIQDKGFLKFDYMLFKWTWELDEIRRRSCLSDNVVTVLASRILQLPKPTQDVLKLASCFGSHFDVRALDTAKSALGVDCCVYRCLLEACEKDFVIQLDEAKYKFSHGSVELAAFGLLPEDLELERLHLDIGLLLHKNDIELLQEDDSMLFTTVYHLNEGSGLVGGNLKADVARLNYLAGTKAAALSAFSQAASYAETGIEVLGPNLWTTHHGLELKLHELCAKAKDCLEEVDCARFYAQQVIEHANSWEEKRPSILVLIDAIKSENKTQEVVDFCWGVLESLGENIPRKPNAIQMKWEYRKMKHWLQGKSAENLSNLSPMVEITKDLALKILCELTLPLCQLGQSMMVTMLVCRMVRITKEYGVCQATPEALALAGIHLVYHGHNVSLGHKLGEVALTLLKKEGTKERHAHVSQLVAANLKWWRDPTPKCLDLLTTANKNAMEAGAISGAFQAIVTYGVNYFYSGLPLDPLLQDVEKCCEQFLQHNNVFFFLMGSPLWQCLNVLTGKCKHMEEGTVIDRLKSFDVPNIIGQQSLWCFSMQVAFYFGDIEKATEMAQKILSTSPGITKWSFFFALIHISNYRLTHKRKDKEEAARIVELFRKLVKAGAINLVHKLQLLEAETMSFSRKGCDRAFQKYNEAIVSLLLDALLFFWVSGRNSL